MSLWMCQQCHALQGFSRDMTCFACEGPLEFTTVKDPLALDAVGQPAENPTLLRAPDTSSDLSSSAGVAARPALARPLEKVMSDDDEPLHAGDDARLDLVTSIHAAATELDGDDEVTDIAAGILEDCVALDVLLLETIKREREAPALARPAWQPIASAPKYREPILGYQRGWCMNGGEINITTWSAEWNAWQIPHADWQPTHWLALPPPPEAEK